MRIIMDNGMIMNDYAHRIGKGSRYGRCERHCHQTCEGQCSESVKLTHVALIQN